MQRVRRERIRTELHARAYPAFSRKEERHEFVFANFTGTTARTKKGGKETHGVAAAAYIAGAAGY